MFLFQYRKLGPQGQVRVQWLCLQNDPFATTKAELSQQLCQGATNESISESITNIMALPVSYSMGTQVSVQSIKWENSRAGRTLYSVIFSAVRN